ncbi:MAG: cupin [Dehalococcoidia bacterium]|nr:cupin [Dehalococcoidia bacterium]
MEKQIERLREPEPEPDNYDQVLKWTIEQTRRRNEGKVLIKGSDVAWVHSRNSYGKRYITPFDWGNVSAPGWIIAITNQQIIRRGKHTHKGGGRLLYALEGKGRTINNGINLDWEEGDLELLAVTRTENVHQHFNLEPGKPCGMLVLMFWPFMEATANETRQITDSPDWKGERTEELYRPDDFVPQSAHLNGYEIDVDSSPQTLLDDLFLQRNRWRQMMDKARWIVKAKDQTLETNRMGIYRWFVHPSFTDLACRQILFWTHDIPPGSRSGTQKHQGGRIHFVVEGRGYSLIDGKRYDWERHDLFMLPIKAGGVVVQHWNADPEKPAKLAVAEPNWYDILGPDMACGFEQLDDCPEYRNSRK